MLLIISWSCKWSSFHSLRYTLTKNNVPQTKFGKISMGILWQRASCIQTLKTQTLVLFSIFPETERRRPSRVVSVTVLDMTYGSIWNEIRFHMFRLFLGCGSFHFVRELKTTLKVWVGCRFTSPHWLLGAKSYTYFTFLSWRYSFEIGHAGR